MSQAGRYITGGPTPGVDVLTLEGDLGGPVGPDMSGNINVIADNASVNAGSSVLIVGNAGTNTLTLNVTDVNNGTLIGLNAGNLTISGINNTGVGHLVLNALTSGANNTALGADAATLITSSSGNTAVGSGSLSSYVTGTGQNTALGLDALRDLASGSANTAIGYQAMEGSSSNTNSVAVGYQSLRLGTGVGNTSLGAQAGTAVTTGAANTMVGFQSGLNLTTGNTNIFVGNLAGQNITNSGNNICIGSGGVFADSGAIRIGANGIHTSAFMQGIAGVTPPGTLNMVTVDTGTGQLGSQAIPSGTITSVSTSNATPQFVTMAGNADVDFNLSNLVLGSSLPALTTGVANVGMGQNVLMSITSGERNVAIGFECLADLTTGFSNVAIGRRVMEDATTCGSNTAIGDSALQDATTASNSNVAVGVQAMTLTTSNTQFNTSVGSRANEAFTSGCVENVAVGHLAGYVSGGSVITNVQGNTYIGTGAGNSGRTGANFNIGIGYHSYWDSGSHPATGSYNTMIGYLSGTSYLSTETSNLLISNIGTAGDNNTIRIGTQGTGNAQQNRCFIAGIYGVTPGGTLNMAIIDNNGQLGSQAIPTGMIPWTVVTGASQAMAANNGYIANNAGTINFSLPASSAVGDIIRITGINNATGWQITQGSGQQIFFGTTNTTAGAGGSITSSATRDSIEIVCVVADTIWNVLSVIGNPTIV